MRKITTVLAISFVTLTLTLATVGLGVAVQDAQQPQMTPEQYFELLRMDGPQEPILNGTYKPVVPHIVE